jgi:hypothetical protein
MTEAGMNSCKKAQKAQKAWPVAATLGELRLKPVYAHTAAMGGSLFLDAACVEDAQGIGGGTCSLRLTESRLYTSGRSLRS